MSTIEDLQRRVEQLEREKEQERREKEHERREKEHERREKEHERREKEHERREKEQARREKEQASREKEQASREKEQARREKEQARREKEEAERRREELERQLDPTDYSSYLHLCHHKLFSSLEIQEDSNLTSAGGTTKVGAKYYPLRLKPWGSFPTLHDQCQERLKSVFGDQKHFRPAYAVDMIRDLFSDGPVADEEDMKRFQFFAVEAGTRDIVVKYLAIQRQRASAQSGHSTADQAALPSRIRFLNNPYGLLSSGQTEDEDADKTPAFVPSMTAAMQKDMESRGRVAGDGPPPAKRQSSPRPKLYPDQWCFRVDDSDSHVPIFVIEYKAAHKLRASTIQAALSRTQEEDGLFADVIRAIKSDKTSLDSEVQALVNMKKATAQVVAQAFHYMVEFGLRHCYVASGEVLLLLHLQPEDPRTLYYHLAVPHEDVRPTAEAAGETEDLHKSALALVSTLVLLALEAPPLTQRWKQEAGEMLRKWDEPYPEMPLEDAEDGSFSSSVASRNAPQLPAPAESEAYSDPAKKRQRRRDEDDDSDGQRQYQPPPSSSLPTRTLASQRPKRSSASANAGSGSGSGSRQKISGTPGVQQGNANAPLPYCTQACLLGLRSGGALDMRCPNVRLHQHGAASSPDHHPLTVSQFLACMREQLSRDLDDDCEGLDKYGKFGATSMLFRLTLRPYGYCLVAKGVQRPHVRLLEHELRIYHEPRMVEQQGRLVPVCLGIVDLVREYISYTGAHVTHMLLLSYCGEPLWKKTPPLPADVGLRVERAWAELQRLGISHGDERAPNAVWNAEVQSVMCIDFGEARVRRPRQDRDTQASSPKRQRTLALST